MTDLKEIDKTPEEAQTPPEKSPLAPERNKLLPGIMAVVSGLIGGLLTTKWLRDLSLKSFIIHGLKREVVDSYILAAKQRVESSVLIMKRLMEKTGKTDLKAITKDLTPDKILETAKELTRSPAIRKLLESAEGKKEAVLSADNLRLVERGGMFLKAKEIIEDLTKTCKKTLKDCYSAIKKATAEGKNTDKFMREKLNAKNDFFSKRQSTLENTFAKEVAAEMQLGIRHMPGKHQVWTFAASTVALCAVGWGAYKVTDWLVNGKKEKTTFKQQVDASKKAVDTQAAGAAL